MECKMQKTGRRAVKFYLLSLMQTVSQDLTLAVAAYTGPT